jgi:hypothetical protein
MIAASRDHLDWLRRELAFTDDVVVSSRRCIAESDEALRLAARIQAERTPARPSSFSKTGDPQLGEWQDAAQGSWGDPAR